MKPDATHKHERARWTDPETGKRLTLTFYPDEYTAEQKERWLARKNAELKEFGRRGPIKSTILLREASMRMLSERSHLRAGTVAVYNNSIDKFLDWGHKNHCTRAGHITRERLIEFRDYCRSTGLQASTANRIQRNVATFVIYLHDKLFISGLSKDDIAYALRPHKEPKKAKPLVNPKLLVAAIASECSEVRAFVWVLLMTGMRFSECLNLTHRNIADALPGQHGRIDLEPEQVKTNTARTIWLTESPSVSDALAFAWSISSDGIHVWNLTKSQLYYAQKRIAAAGCPSFTWQTLRRTCGSYLTCAPGIYGAASAFQSAKRLGHSVTIAERLYVGSIRGIPFEAKTLEEAMGIQWNGDWNGNKNTGS